MLGKSPKISLYLYLNSLDNSLKGAKMRRRVVVAKKG
jgi:hypothetical protein